MCMLEEYVKDNYYVSFHTSSYQNKTRTVKGSDYSPAIELSD